MGCLVFQGNFCFLYVVLEKPKTIYLLTVIRVVFK